MNVRIRLLLSFILFSSNSFCQRNSLYDGLPIGSHPVGFKIITITDPSRVTKPLYNYFGEKETGNRSRKIHIHLWYPAKPKSRGDVPTYGEYAINDLYTNTREKIADNLRTGKLNTQRSTLEGFFGKVSDDQWQQITSTKMLAIKDAPPEVRSFPLLVGMLRPLSTAVTNEMLASNGYVVAMIKHSGSRYPAGYIEEIQDMQLAMLEIKKMGIVDDEKIGTFGFSGSGFTQVTFAMTDPRIRALADLESGFFMEGLFQQISSSNLYNAQRLKIPFLHLFGTDASKEEVFIHEFEKLRYADRYRVILNQKKLHHWDFATEGRVSTTVVQLRGESGKAIKASYEIANRYLLNFFDSVLKKTAEFSDTNLSLKNYPDSLHSITRYPALAPPPERHEFVALINRNGIDTGTKLAREIWAKDTLAEVLHENILNLLANDFRREEKRAEALALMKLATELHPKAAWIWNNLASMQEDFGFKDDAIVSSEEAVELLANVQGSELSFNERIKRSSLARLKRLKGQ